MAHTSIETRVLKAARAFVAELHAAGPLLPGATSTLVLPLSLVQPLIDAGLDLIAQDLIANSQPAAPAADLRDEVRAWRHVHAWQVYLLDMETPRTAPVDEAAYRAEEQRLYETEDSWHSLNVWRVDGPPIIDEDDVADPLALANFILQTHAYIDALLNELEQP